MGSAPDNDASSSASLSFEAFTFAVPGAKVRAASSCRAAASSDGEAAVARASDESALPFAVGSADVRGEQEFKKGGSPCELAAAAE